MNEKENFQIPSGVKDILPKEVMKKKVLETKIVQVMSQWGYDEVVTPTIEYNKSLSVGLGENVIEQSYRFFDRDGEILTLRFDVTTYIARLVSKRLKYVPLPLRLFYLANVFRYEDPQAGRQREFYQAGAEFIGDNSPFSDSEVIALAVKCLQEAGLNNFQLSVGHIQLFNELINELNLDEKEKEQIQLTIFNKDFVGLEKLVETLNLTSLNQERIIYFPQLHGKEDILSKADKFIVNAKTEKSLQ